MENQNEISRPQGCSCKLCERHRNMLNIVKSGNYEAMVDLVYDLMNALDHAEMDVEYHEMVLRGVWPDSLEMLENAITSIKEKVPKKLDKI